MIGLRRRVEQLGVVVCFLCGVHAFEATYINSVRAGRSVAPDTLIYYNAIAGWWHRGDTPLGETLLPSPYFIDMLLQLPLFGMSKDFEQFYYDLAMLYWGIVVSGLYLISRRVVRLSAAMAMAASVGTMWLYFATFPQEFIIHVFMQNHTSELGMSLLGAGAFLPRRFRAASGGEASRSRPSRWAIAQVLFVGVNVASSGFFIATYVVPFTAATLIDFAMFRKGRETAITLAAVVAGALLGWMTDVFVSAYLWPIRLDRYENGALESFAAWSNAVRIYSGRAFLWGALAATTVSTLIAVRRWRRRVSEPEGGVTVALVAFGVTAALATNGVPVARGAFLSAYEFRYVQLPCVLAVFAFVVVCGEGVRRLVRRLPTWGAIEDGLRRKSANGAIVVAAIVASAVLVASLEGPLSRSSLASNTAPLIECFERVQRDASLKEGVATVVLSRFLNAARARGGSESRDVIMEMFHWDPPSVQPSENNRVNFREIERRGRTINFIATDRFSRRGLEYFVSRVGRPDRTFRCPMPSDWVVDNAKTFEIWVYDTRAAQDRLAKLVAGDPMRGVFGPPWHEKTLDIQPIWGMVAAKENSVLEDGRWVWRSEEHPPAAVVASSKPFFVPSGRYRATVEVSATGSENEALPRAEFVAALSGRILSRGFLIRGESRAVIEFDVYNHGGPTSGEYLDVFLVAGRAERIEVSGMTVEQLESTGVDVLRLVR